MKKFEVNAMYWDTSAVDHTDVMVIKITRRTEKSVWFVRMRGGEPEGEPARTKIFTNANYEYIMPYRYSMAPVWDADRKVEPEAAANDEPQEAASDAPETADDNKAAAMTAQEETARKMIHEQTTEYLLNQWEATTTNNDPFIPTVRGWLMDELQSRYPEAYDKWLDSEVCEDAALREYINAAIQAEQDATQADNKEEPKMTLENIYSQTLSNLDANDGDIVGVAVYTDGGDTVEEFNYELSGRYGIFKYEDGTFSDEYETDDLKEALDYLKEETEGTVRRVDYAIFDRDARQYIQIRATAKGRKAFKTENERLAAKSATPVNQTEHDSAEAGQPAPQEAPDDGEPDALEVVRILGGTLNLIKDNGGEVEAMKARFALWEQVEEFKRRGVTLNVEYDADGRFVGVTEPKAGMKFDELPESVQAKVKEYLRAYDDCSVTYERGAYRVSVGVGITARYAPDFKVCGRYAADDIFTEAERVLNYANSFYSYPPEYCGERDYRMMKAAQERGAKLEYDNAGNIVAAA